MEAPDYPNKDVHPHVHNWEAAVGIRTGFYEKRPGGERIQFSGLAHPCRFNCGVYWFVPLDPNLRPSEAVYVPLDAA